MAIVDSPNGPPDAEGASVVTDNREQMEVVGKIDNPTQAILHLLSLMHLQMKEILSQNRLSWHGVHREERSLEMSLGSLTVVVAEHAERCADPRLSARDILFQRKGHSIHVKYEANQPTIEVDGKVALSYCREEEEGPSERQFDTRLQLYVKLRELYLQVGERMAARLDQRERGQSEGTGEREDGEDDYIGPQSTPRITQVVEQF